MSSQPVLLRCKDKTVDLTRPVVMGVINVTPDSFSDGGRFLDADAAVAHGLALAETGAAFIDVGGESTRPGAAPVSVEEELRRVIPVIERLRAASAVVLSIDTSKPEVMRRAAAAGAGLINDVRALRAPGALQAARASGCAVGLMHMQGEPRTMQLAPTYSDVVSEVGAFLAARAKVCLEAGFAAEELLIDPGFGFGKTLEHNLTLLRRLGELTAIGPPVLVGLSRKSMVGKLTGRAEGERQSGSVVLAVIAALAGARVVRAHDVAATVEALRVVAALRDVPAARAGG
ncbi:MAG TPA: dihydropteroate synthase [Steroidobacteraceae bacterium]|jgi:dihydropteroate synthase|nr:dihydropteroate synthase [Steroidobacteraceae bacterium]